ncbi:MAG: NlpC/P60 family protein [Bilifractor sp.]|jgi:cell wall-associated NlpC family hydrolase
MRKSKLFLMGLAAVVAVGQFAPAVMADTTISSVQKEKENTSAKLTELQNTITELEKKKSEVTGQIDSLNGQLVTSIAEIQDLSDQIDQKNAQLEQIQKDLNSAEEKRNTEYKAMKKRIQYIYENGGDAGWGMVFLSTGNVSKLLTQSEYTEKMYDYDRECLQEYSDTLQEITDLKTEQETEKQNLEYMKQDQETNKSHLETLLSQAKATSSNYDAQLADSNAKAEEYQQLLEEENAKIAELAEVAAESSSDGTSSSSDEDSGSSGTSSSQKSSGSSTQSSGSTSTKSSGSSSATKSSGSSSSTKSSGSSSSTKSSGSSSSTKSSGSSSSTKSSGSSSSTESSGSSSSTKSSGSSSSTSTSTSTGNSSLGSAIANYACQFIGNPYVYGGTSLTNGCDCSGFVMQVYAHFGYSLPHSSSAMRSVGRAVSSLSEAQPGDILCYSGHVGIYVGGGTMVNASNSKPYPAGGIKYTNASYRTILAIRRLV